MQQRRRFRRIGVDLDGLIQFPHTGDEMDCMVRNISEECMGAMIFTPDQRIRKREDVNLDIFIPTERTPILCSGKIVWYSEDEEAFRNYKGYSAGIIITDISRIDQRRLELVMARSATPDLY